MTSLEFSREEWWIFLTLVLWQAVGTVQGGWGERVENVPNLASDGTLFFFF